MTLSARASTMRAFETAIDVGSRNPVRGSFTGCCASRALLVRKSAADKQTKTWGDSGLHLSTPPSNYKTRNNDNVLQICNAFFGARQMQRATGVEL